VDSRVSHSRILLAALLFAGGGANGVAGEGAPLVQVPQVDILQSLEARFATARERGWVAPDGAILPPEAARFAEEVRPGPEPKPVTVERTTPRRNTAPRRGNHLPVPEKTITIGAPDEVERLSRELEAARQE